MSLMLIVSLWDLNFRMCQTIYQQLKSNHFIKMSTYFRWPWNQETINGWIIDKGMAFLTGLSYFSVNAMFLTFFISNCEYCRSFHGYYQSIIEDIDQIDSNDLKALDKAWGRVVTFHITIKQ